MSDFVSAVAVSIRASEFDDLDDRVEFLSEAVATFSAVVPGQGVKADRMSPLGCALGTWKAGKQMVADARLPLSSARVAKSELEAFTVTFDNFKAKYSLASEQNLLAVDGNTFMMIHQAGMAVVKSYNEDLRNSLAEFLHTAESEHVNKLLTE